MKPAPNRLKFKMEALRLGAIGKGKGASGQPPSAKQMEQIRAKLGRDI